MRTVGREVIGRLDYDLLIANANHPADVCHVTIAAGAVHRKGEVLEMLDGGKCDILGTATAANAAAVEEGTETEGAKTEGTAAEKAAVAAYILAEDVDAGEEDVVASAYRSGSFIRNALIVKEGYTLTAEDEAALRNGGIYLSDAVL
jgi:hypothetical protein